MQKETKNTILDNFNPKRGYFNPFNSKINHNIYNTLNQQHLVNINKNHRSHRNNHAFLHQKQQHHLPVDMQKSPESAVNGSGWESNPPETCHPDLTAALKAEAATRRADTPQNNHPS